MKNTPNSRSFLILSLLSLALLQACGGGGDGDNTLLSPATGGTPTTPGTPSPPAIADSGSVSAPFVRGDNARYEIFGVSSQSFGRLTQSEQAGSGAMTTLSGNILSGASVTQDIKGDASFAMGRWVAGTVTRASGAETLTGTDNRTYHYIAFNALTALPATGAMNCDAGVFTTPTYLGGGTAATAAISGTANGSASLSFGTGGAVVAGSVNVLASGLSATTSLNTTVPSASTTPITGAFLSGGSGAAITVVDGGGGVYAIVAGYSATLSNGARYTGIARFRCA